jgi:hypothetical protein
MSELIALLMVTVSQLLGAGVPPAELAAQVRAAVLEAAPMEIADAATAIAPESAEEDTDQPRPQPDRELWRLTFTFDEIYLEPLLVRELEIEVGKLHLQDDGSLRIGSLAFTAEFTQEALTEALAAKASTVHNPRVILQPDGITLKGSYGTWLGRVPFEVKGNLSVEEQTQLIFSIDKSKMIGVPIPGPVNRIIQREVNPVYDLDAFAERSRKDIQRARDLLDYEFYLEVDRITPKQGHIIVTGHA